MVKASAFPYVTGGKRNFGGSVDWYTSVVEVIDLRSFSNLWYWIGLAVMWSTLSHWILGVPYDLIMRARRKKTPEAVNDLQDLTRVNANRILHVFDTSGTWLALFGSALVTTLVLGGVLYNIEFAQAVVLMLFPAILVALLSVRTARIIRRDGLTGEELVRRLLRQRMATQAIGVVSIFVTAMYGMYKNLYTGPFGGF